MQKNTKTHLLIIVAHPDDESFLFAGTSLKFRKAGKNVAVICATRGEKGNSKLGKPATEKQLAKIRERELHKACKILGIKSMEFLGYKDGQMINENFGKLVRVIIRKINQIRPGIIATFGKEGMTGHNDHITIGKAAVAGAKKAKYRPSQIWLVSNPSSVMRRFNKFFAARRVHHSHYRPGKLKGTADAKLTRINIKKHAKKKLAAINSHKSQLQRPFKLADFAPNIRQVIFRYEYFEII